MNRADKKKACTALAVTAAVTAAAAVPLFMLAPGKPDDGQKKVFSNRTYAHRGLHSEDKSVPENSLKAFALAAEAGYGVELDVHVTTDGKIVVFHDDTLDRVCGVSGKIEDRSFEELQQLRLCGTEERIPLFSEVLSVIDGRGPIIVELKRGARNGELCRLTYEILRGYKGDYCIESFDPFIVRWFKKNAPEVLRGQLATRRENYKGSVKPATAVLMSSGLSNMLCRPQFIAYEKGKRPLTVKLALAMGAMNVAWTVREEKDAENYDSVIFEFFRPEKTVK